MEISTNNNQYQYGISPGVVFSKQNTKVALKTDLQVKFH